MSEALFYANALEVSDKNPALINVNNRAAAELRRLHAELERKSDAIQRLWKERDELRSECRTLVRQNGEWQELTAELVEALRRCRDMVEHPDNLAFIDAALAKVEASK